MDRRDFVRLGTVLGALPSARASFAFSLPENQKSHNLDFWLNGIRKPSKPLTLKEANTKLLDLQISSASTLVNLSRSPVFVFLDESQPQKKFVEGTEVTPSIPDGDANITVKVMRFRPSQDDVAKFNNIKSGSLKIDVSQQVASSPSVGQLAWSAIAGLLPGGDGKLPDTSQLQFDPGTAWGDQNKVSLPEGSGRWAWNFFLQKKDSLWEKILQQAHNALSGGALQLLFPALSLPAIAVTSLTFVDKLVGYLTNVSNEQYLFNSSDISVTATVKGAKTDPNTVRLTTGRYLVVPQEHAPSLADELTKDSSLLISNEGYLLPAKDVGVGQSGVAATVAKDVTYLSLYVTAAAPASSGH